MTLELARDGRPLATELHLPRGDPPWPFVVFAHGWMGHPRKFTHLFARWNDAGFAVAAPAFPHTSDESPASEFDDVAEQPADLRFVLDRLLDDERFDPARVVFGGLSLGAATVLGAVFARTRPELRARAVLALSGRLPWFAAMEPRPCPLLVVHGLHDEVVPYAAGLDAFTWALPPKALLTIEVRGHSDFVENDPATPADGVVADVTAAFLATAVAGAAADRPAPDPVLARLETDGIW